MLRIAAKRLSTPLVHSTKHSFGLFKTLLHLMRTALNRVRWEENQQFTALEKRSSNVPQNSQQATKLFLATEQQISLSEKGRLQRIDDILGTRTHFHEGKVYHERIDSDHLMEIQQLKKQNPETKRQHLNWLNPQADIKIRYKNKRNYYQLVSQLSTYPHHPQGKFNLADETDEKTIAFLGLETAYTKISLKPIQLTAASMEQQSLLLPPEPPFQSQRYCYFRPQYSMQLLRVPKTLYTANLLDDSSTIAALGPQVQEVISLEEIYEALKAYDTDERVHQYLRKVENNRIEYLFSDLSFDRTENLVAITIDILDNGKEHCILVKSLISKQATLKPIFNVKPPVSFSPDGKDIFYVQRSAEGGWIQLVKRSVQSCWSQSNGIIQAEEDSDVIYRCPPQKQLAIGNDTNRNFIFLTVRDYGKPFSQNLFVLGLRDDSINLYKVDEDGRCQYFYDMSGMGLVLGKKREVQSGDLKYGENLSYIESVELIPFKEHIQLQSDKVGLSELLPGSTSSAAPGPQELDFHKKKCIYIPEQHQYITQIEVRSTHLIIVLNYASVYDRAILYMLPFKANAHPHSLILKGSPQIKLRSNTYVYESQQVQFSQGKGPMLFQKVYNIWKRQLRQNQREASRYHCQVMQVQDHYHPFELQFLCKSIYLDENELPIVLYLTTKGEQIDQQVLRQLLEKGIGVVQFCGRGTFHKDLEHFLSGSRHNFSNMLDDIKAAIEFLGNNISSNISLYSKGQISSLAGLWFNIYFPYLFNASVLHNGIYDLSDQVSTANCADFFGNINNDNIQTFDFKKFNPFEHKFKTLTPLQQKTKGEPEKKSIQIGYMENIIISSDKTHRVQSRKLIKLLRQNSLLRYDSVYLSEYDDPYSTDLHNLSFLYAKIRARLEREVNEPSEEDSQDN